MLCTGHFCILMEAPHALAFERRGKAGRLIVIANRDKAPLAFDLPHPARELLEGTCARGRITVAPDTVQIWRVNDVQTRMGKMDEKQESEQ